MAQGSEEVFHLLVQNGPPVALLRASRESIWSCGREQTRVKSQARKSSEGRIHKKKRMMVLVLAACEWQI